MDRGERRVYCVRSLLSNITSKGSHYNDDEDYNYDDDGDYDDDDGDDDDNVK